MKTGLAWLIIPTDIGVKSASFTYNSWRIFLLICAAPSFIVAGLLLLLPESPKYLITRGRYDEALDIFRGIYATNTGKPRDTYTVSCSIEIYIYYKLIDIRMYNYCMIYAQVKELILDEFHMNEPVKPGAPEKNKYKVILGDIMENSRQLFVRPILRFTVISIIINFTFHIGYYGLMMWFPELFNRFDEFHREHPGQSASVCEVTSYVVNKGSHSDENFCTDKIGASVFQESLITVAAAIPANVVAVLLMDRLGRKFFLGIMKPSFFNITSSHVYLYINRILLRRSVFSTLSSGACSSGLYFVRNKIQNLSVSAVFSGVISCGNAALDCLITEVFPTHLRATGIAISMVAARLGGIIGNIVIAQLLDVYCPLPTFIVAALLIGKNQ